MPVLELSPKHDAAPTVRALRAWSAADRTRLGSALDNALARWAGAWSLVGASWLQEAAVVDAASDVRDSIETLAWHSAGVSGLWWSLHESSAATPATRSTPSTRARQTPRRILLSALFNETAAPLSIRQETRLCELLADDAWRACWTELAAALSMQLPDGCAGPAVDDSPAAALPREVFRPFGGAMLARLRWCDRTLALLMDGATVARALTWPPEASTPQTTASAPPRAAASPLIDALASQPLSMCVELEPTDIDLGTLAGLRVGDVLWTQHRLDTPLLLHTAPMGDSDPGSPWCRGHLGRLRGRRAIELQRLAASEP